MELILLGLFVLYVLMGAGAYKIRKAATGNDDLVIVLATWPIMLCIHAFLS